MKSFLFSLLKLSTYDLLLLFLWLVSVEVSSRFVVRCTTMKVFAKILLLKPVITVINMLLELLSIRQQTLTTIVANIFLGEDFHCGHHLVIRSEIEEKSTLRVDKVVTHTNWYFFSPWFRLKNDTVKSINRWWWHINIKTMIIKSSYLHSINMIFKIRRVYVNQYC